MKLKLTEIINTPGARIPFECSFDFSSLDIMGQTPAAEPVRLHGEVQNRAGILEMPAALDAHLNCVCDRCSKEFERDWHFDFIATLAADFEDEDDENYELFPLEDDSIDLEEVATVMFLLNMDTKFLCSPDCKGLCERCGADLNLGPCGCKNAVDPRLAVLAQLLEEE